jgi:hypothetical protein
MSSTSPRAKNWCFTLNNYTDADIERICALSPQVNYLVFGKEVGASGTPHLQGFVSFQSRKRLNQCISIIGQAHFSVTRYVQQSIDYCKKDGDFTEIGDPPASKGERSDLEEFKNSVKEGVTSMKDLREQHSNVCAMYPRFVKEYLADHRKKVSVELHPLYNWQSELYQKLNRTPDRRKIIFIVDLVGNQGKSWFCRYYTDSFDNSQLILPGKKADMAYMVREDCRVFLIDAPRSKQGDFIQYDFLEELKNGLVFSPKYESCTKKFDTPHVVVAMNEYPDMTKLSNDRYDIISLT